MPLLRDTEARLGGAVAFLGVNVQDGQDGAVAFLEELDVTYDQARDPTGEYFTAAGACGMPTTLLVDPDGGIQFMEVTAEGIGRNAAELLRKVKAAQYVASHPGEVCPAKWEEGEKTLAPSLDLVGKI